MSRSNSDNNYFIYTSNKDVDGVALRGVKTDTPFRFNTRTQVYYTTAPGKALFRSLETSFQPDAVFIVGLFDYNFNLIPVFCSKTKLKVLSVRGMLHPGALRQKAFKKKLFLKMFNVMKMQRRVRFHATDEQESVHINNVFPDADIAIAANYGGLTGTAVQILKEQGVLKLVMIALISPMKNHLLVVQALSAVRSQVSLYILGAAKDERYLAQLRNAAAALPKNINVKFCGPLPAAEVFDTLEAAHVLIMPSESENYGHAIAEALSIGRPVITSKFTPWDNLAEAGVNVDLSESAVAAAVEHFASMDQTAFDNACRAAKNYWQVHADIEQTDKAYKQLFS